MNHRQLIEQRIESLIETNPEFVQKLDALLAQRELEESKHLVTHRDLSVRDTYLQRRDKRAPHLAQDREEKRTKEALAAAIGAVHLAGGLSQRLLRLLTQAERYLRSLSRLDTFLAEVDRQDPKMFRAIRKAEYDRGLLRSRYASTMEAAKEALRDGWKKSYRMGVRSAGVGLAVSRLSSGESRWVSRAAMREMTFFNRMISDIKAGKPVPKMASRIRMYGKAILAAFTAGQVAATGPGTIIHWLLDPQAQHCEDCLFLQASGPYLKDTLPTTPRAGLCRCRCITTPESLILTARGEVPIGQVVVGDYVWTHRSRWRQVVGTPRHVAEQPLEGARVGGGSVFTADHKFWTLDGWVQVASVAEMDLQMIHPQYAKVLRDVLGANALGSPIEDLPTVRELVSNVWCGEGPTGLGVPVVWEKAQGVEAVGGAVFGGAYSCGFAAGWVATSPTIHGSDRGEFYQREERWEALGELLGWEEEEIRVPLPVALDCAVRGGTQGVCTTPQERGLHRRPVEQLEADDGTRARLFAWTGKSPSIASCTIPSGVVLYDLTVEEDHSFVVDGMIVSNSNCKCRLEFEVVSDQVAEMVRANNYSKRYLLNKIRRGDSMKRRSA